jgi:hypothetical protein
MKVTQRQAVYSAVVSVFNESGIEFFDGVDAKAKMSKEHRGQVNAILVLGFMTGEIELKDTEANRAKLADASLMKEYVSGLQSNWLAKDERLNGGVDHQIKNPGSRTGGSDEQLKALRALHSTLTSASDRAEIQEMIDARVTALTVTKTKQVEINYDALPESLRAKYAK